MASISLHEGTWLFWQSHERIKRSRNCARLRSELRKPGQGLRLLAIAMVLDGYSRREAATASGMDRQTLCNRVQRYNEASIDVLADRARSGRPACLSEAERAEVATRGIRAGISQRMAWSAFAVGILVIIPPAGSASIRMSTVLASSYAGLAIAVCPCVRSTRKPILRRRRLSKPILPAWPARCSANAPRTSISKSDSRMKPGSVSRVL